eukprot:CAMPEP_0168187468 /NCGR_PEP_ID=MMETSP0139_2-20121125/15047_1 /TAXON_ID=44445 /ORGANISM="Pseudo-nitzschia australis, Strain 10249 10 AB" /LENGTH=48 /DNA_ID= /DNA_START= /DNA_END= /DNA_ORIENTATION=
MSCFVDVDVDVDTDMDVWIGHRRYGTVRLDRGVSTICTEETIDRNNAV